MRNLKTHFEQVPIEVVRTILRQQTDLAEPTGQPLPVDEQEPEENLFEVIGYPDKKRGERP